jgi:3-oxoacid CoA-transferase subunit A
LGGELEVGARPQGTFSEQDSRGRRRRGRIFADRLRRGRRREGDAAYRRKHYVLLAVRADFAFVHAWQGDRVGNRFTGGRRNFNPVMATAARITIAESSTLSAGRHRSRSMS